MKYRLPSVTGVMLLLAATLAGGQERDGQLIVARAAEQMRRHPSLEAKIRQRVAIGEQRLLGSGTYLQVQDGDGFRFQLDLRLQVGDQITSLSHLNDGEFLWIRRDLGNMQSLSRIDLKRVNNVVTESLRSPSSTLRPGLGTGGLAQLLQNINRYFVFGPPVPAEISGVAVWNLQGEWHPQAVEELVSGRDDRPPGDSQFDITNLPPQLPDRVSLTIGQEDRLPLFPYRIEFSRSTGAGDGQLPLLTMELFEVRLRPDLDPRSLRFQLGEQRVEDETDLYLKKLGLSPN